MQATIKRHWPRETRTVLSGKIFIPLCDKQKEKLWLSFTTSAHTLSHSQNIPFPVHAFRDNDRSVW